MNLTQKIAAAAGALTLGAAGVAAAATSDTADSGTKVPEQVTVEQSDTHGAPDGADDSTTEDGTGTAEATGDEGTGPVDNHGAAVSAVAHSDFATGREHGAAVSAVAHGTHGAEAGNATPEAAGEADDEVTQGPDATDVESDHSGGHGRP